jgi:Ser/Thr protein kinase RdoA (MazF antagonist)
LLDSVLAAYDLGGPRNVTLLSISENITYQVENPAAGRRWALRLHRPGYHSLQEIVSELLWTQTLRCEGVVSTPRAVPTRHGDLIAVTATVSPSPAAHAEPQYAVLFDWAEGSPPASSDVVGLVRRFAELGGIAARLHQHVSRWQRPADFTRFAWTWRTMLGADGRWGSWRDGIRAAVGAEQSGASMADPGCVAVLSRAAGEIRRRIGRFGHDADRFGLVHADMRLANLLVDGQSEELTVIDFDDCGFSWYLYDLAASLSFIEHVPQVGDLVDAWLTSYRRYRPVSAEEEAMAATFILLRRLLLVAWLGSHPQADAVDSVPQYVAASCDLADDYLSGRC